MRRRHRASTAARRRSRRSSAANLFVVALDRPAPVVSLPPPLRRRPPGAPRDGASGRRRGPASRERATGSRRTAIAPRRSATRWRRKAFERAAELVEHAIPAMRRTRREATFDSGSTRCPRASSTRGPSSPLATPARCCRPETRPASPSMLRRAEPWLNDIVKGAARTASIVAEESELRRFPACSSSIAPPWRRSTGDLAGNMAHARRLLEVVGPDDHIERGGAEAFLGLGYWEHGRSRARHPLVHEGNGEPRAGRLCHRRRGRRDRDGRPRACPGEPQRHARRLRARPGAGDRSRSADPPRRGRHVRRAERRRVRARTISRRPRSTSRRPHRFGEDLAFPRYPYRSRLAQARILQARGDLDGALEQLAEADRRYRPTSRRTSADPGDSGARADRPRPPRRRAGMGTHERHRRGVRGSRISTSSACSRSPGCWLAEGAGKRRGCAHRPTARRPPRQAAELGASSRSSIVDALARHAAGDADGALRSLDRAIELAEPEGFVRLFLDEGEFDDGAPQGSGEAPAGSGVCPTAPGRVPAGRCLLVRATGA